MHHRETGRGDVFENATESVTSFAASGNPLTSLPTRDALIFVAKARGLNMSGVARVLKISRETLYVKLRRARAELEGAAARGAWERPALVCACGQAREPGRGRCAACWRRYQRDWARAARGLRRVDSAAPDSGCR